MDESKKNNGGERWRRTKERNCQTDDRVIELTPWTINQIGRSRDDWIMTYPSARAIIVLYSLKVCRFEYKRSIKVNRAKFLKVSDYVDGDEKKKVPNKSVDFNDPRPTPYIFMVKGVAVTLCQGNKVFVTF